MEVRAVARYLPISAQKIRLVCDQVRGMDADQALTVLRFMPQKGAEFAYKLIESAVANGEINLEMNRQDLFISSLMADEGPSLKRVKAGARGRYKPRTKRTSHLTVVLREREEESV
ncbi:50S ribosomal protein L22 [Aggregatilinea lenta]|uniref:50S ribosomal protein L22 n=1 Tax=Aggregatilinea lenta TaxID=913108 RepID=UPI000E5B1349|nr:50S ribosomal protein L22 [Aggregatilinea lenta]